MPCDALLHSLGTTIVDITLSKKARHEGMYECDSIHIRFQGQANLILDVRNQDLGYTCEEGEGHNWERAYQDLRKARKNILFLDLVVAS